MASAAFTALTPLSSTTTDPRMKLTRTVTSQSIQTITPPDSPIDKDVSRPPSPYTPTTLAPLSASLTINTPINSPNTMPSVATSSDYMLTCNWTASNGWSAPNLQPYGPLSFAPTASVLHYSTTCFEGLKCYRGVDGRMRLFRPNLNCERMVRSATRIALPTFDPVELQKLIKMLVAHEAPRRLPRDQGTGHLYLRPTLVGTTGAIGIQTPTEALLFVLAVVMGDMVRSKAQAQPPPSPPLTGLGIIDTAMDAGTKTPPEEPEEEKLGMYLLASAPSACRSWPGGFGHAKVGANYGPTLTAQAEAKARGFDQVLWLFGHEGWVTEAGGANFFVVWRNRETGQRELVTAPIAAKNGEHAIAAEAGLILEGVTRRSVLEASRNGWINFEEQEKGSIEVVERDFTMADVITAHREGRLEEAFGCGTAYFVAPVQKIDFRGEVVTFPLREGNSAAADADGGLEGCPVAMAVKRFLKGVMYGEIPGHEWAVVVDEEELDEEERT